MEENKKSDSEDEVNPYYDPTDIVSNPFNALNPEAPKRVPIQKRVNKIQRSGIQAESKKKGLNRSKAISRRMNTKLNKNLQRQNKRNSAKNLY